MGPRSGRGGEQGIYDTFYDVEGWLEGAPVEFPGFSKLSFPTSHVPVDWGEIKAGKKKMPTPPKGHGSYVPVTPYSEDKEEDLKWVVWGTCDFFSKKQ